MTTEVTSVATGTVNPQIVPSQITLVCGNCEKLRAEVERLKGERDALREKTDNEFHDAAVAYAVQSAALEQLKGERERAWAALQEESENSAYHLKELRETEAALSQAQQALRLAIEFGYKGCERGWNLEKTLLEFK